MKELRKKIYSFITLIMVVLIMIFSGCIEINQDEEFQTISAKDAFESIDEVLINNYHSNLSYLISVNDQMMTTERGLSKGWSFYYYIFLNETHFRSVSIKIFASSDIEIFEYEKIHNIMDTDISIKGIQNWIIDSDEAMDIATGNETISEFIKKYEDANIDDMRLVMRERYSEDDAIWVIWWSYMKGWDDPVNAQIVINANTGEVLYVDADI